MGKLAPMPNALRSSAVTTQKRPEPDAAWAAFTSRDRNGTESSWEPSKQPVSTANRAARRGDPNAKIWFFTTPPRRQGTPGSGPASDANRTWLRATVKLMLADAAKLIEQAESPPTLAQLAAVVGYAPHHFQRLFKRGLGVSPAHYARSIRNRRSEQALRASERVTDAVYDAGYNSPSHFYSDARERLGMTPSAWRDGGRGETIRWTVFDSPLGPMLIAVTSKGICRLVFEQDPASLERLFPKATIIEDEGGLRGSSSSARSTRSITRSHRPIFRSMLQERLFRNRSGASSGKSLRVKPEAMPTLRPRSESPRPCEQSGVRTATIISASSFHAIA